MGILTGQQLLDRLKQCAGRVSRLREQSIVVRVPEVPDNRTGTQALSAPQKREVK